MIPYSRQLVDDEDIKAVIDALRSDWLTTGPKISEFEEIFAKSVNAKYAIAVSSGTAALHAAMYSLNIKPGDEVIVPTISFAASANCVVYQGGKPVFADVTPDTLLLDPVDVENKITGKTKAIIAVDYAGQACDYDELRKIAIRHNLFLIDDACHALGGSYKNRRLGSIADLNIFSFHAVKHITTGEGGMITTNSSSFAEKMRIFRNHGIKADHRQREALGSWYYEMTDLGYNYRLTDFQCALGISQLSKLPQWIARRQEIAGYYDKAFTEIMGVTPLKALPDVVHAYHLYVVRFDTEGIKKDRGVIFKALRDNGIGVNVHYIPIHLHPFYQKTFKTGTGDCPIAEQAYQQIISLPMFQGLGNADVKKVIEAVKTVAKRD
jgi:perosamine synthetase